MSWENVTYAMQVNATKGDGYAPFFPEARGVDFYVRGNGSVTGGAVTIECCPGNAPMTNVPLLSSGTGWTALTTIAVPPNAEVRYSAADVVGNVRARISTPVTGGTVTVTAVRPEEQKGWSRRPS